MDPIDKTGGPAFPMIRDMRHSPDWDHEPGMNLRDWFATHAPTEIPNWFKHEPANPRARVLSCEEAVRFAPDFSARTLDEINQAEDWLRDPFSDPIGRPELVRACWDAMRAIANSRNLFESGARQTEAERYIAWRWHYADLMLQRRVA